MSIKKIIDSLMPALCLCCEKEIQTLNDGFCRECRQRVIYINNGEGSSLLHVFKYEGPIIDLLHNFKYKKRRFYARKIGLLLADFLEKNCLSLECSIVPVPLHWKKEFVRGFNQSALMSAYLARISKRELVLDALVKVKNTGSQTSLNKRRRESNVKDSLRVKKAGRIAGKHILIVDDVYTTGATVSEAKKMLLAAGAKKITAVTLARATL